ncbi:HigA family addiction module antitoxin [uncultured Corynebacterium sp.]|uniref:HigA family addiction module antitoxin n=1 Tax=uncultured Corynebacterium sp. TaxID=159447 RepID=UPI0025EFE24B|nr:HigA family addiction module antitoxin [uncultured Corynebacterium sp.]
MSTSPTTTNNHPHPGEWLVTEMLEPMGISQYRLAKDLHVAESQISRIVRGQAGITAPMALKLEAYFGLDARFWLNLQYNYDLAEARATVDTADITPHSAA